MTVTLNALIDAPATDPDAPEPLADVATLDLRDLGILNANYARRAHHDAIWCQDSFTVEERDHWRAIERAYDLHEAARRFTVTQGLTTYSEAIEDWQMRHPIAPPTAAELAAMADEIPF